MPRIAIAMRDYASAVSTFQDKFGMPVVDLSDRTVPELGANIGMCVPVGGSNIELMSPVDPAAPLSQSLLKFLDRRGDGLYALMLEAPDPNAEADALTARGIDVLPLMAGAGGRDLHPRSLHGVLIRVYPVNSAGDLSGHTGGEPGLSGIHKVTIATEDASVAAKVYGHGLGLDVGPATIDEKRGIQVAIARPPEGGLIELVSPVDESKPLAANIGNHLRQNGQGMYGLTLGIDDADTAVQTMTANGLQFEPTGDGFQQTSVFGTRLAITPT